MLVFFSMFWLFSCTIDGGQGWKFGHSRPFGTPASFGPTVTVTTELVPRIGWVRNRLPASKRGSRMPPFSSQKASVFGSGGTEDPERAGSIGSGHGICGHVVSSCHFKGCWQRGKKETLQAPCHLLVPVKHPGLY